ncbi:hypothetical protein Goari_006909 [Gossypium aridum]|uniref:DUF4283 domain-containing protein n=1 Tax=Gossypium aridum TaxID=34290 RepID=A0A7J8XQ24_GOSAI|nr:hypothetical protein [Gossypium aridum]
MATMEEELANLNIVVEEEEPVQTLEEKDTIEEEYNLCLVGRVLTNSVVHFPSIRNILAKLWHPLEGISITEIEEKRILFRFYHKIDLKRVWDVVSWSHVGGNGEAIWEFLWAIHRIWRYITSEGERLGHGESFCPIQLTLGSQKAVFGWDISLKAPPLRATSVASKWLREDPMEG